MHPMFKAKVNRQREVYRRVFRWSHRLARGDNNDIIIMVIIVIIIIYYIIVMTTTTIIIATTIIRIIML